MLESFGDTLLNTILGRILQIAATGIVGIILDRIIPYLHRLFRNLLITAGLPVPEWSSKWARKPPLKKASIDDIQFFDRNKDIFWVLVGYYIIEGVLMTGLIAVVAFVIGAFGFGALFTPLGGLGSLLAILMAIMLNVAVQVMAVLQLIGLYKIFFLRVSAGIKL